jgi:hypothetical protein
MHGFTLIMPAGWGMPFWQSLVFTGSLIAGLKERRNQHLEAGKPSFPEDYPHTQAGRAYWATRAAQDQLRWLSKPASKRLNFTRLQGSDPWKPNWTQLSAAQEKRLYTAEEEEMNGNSKKQFETWLLSAWLAQPDELSSIASSTAPELALQQAVNRYREALSLNPLHMGNTSALYRSCIVRGVLSFDEGGSPKDMAFIFQFDDDLEDHVSRVAEGCYLELTKAFIIGFHAGLDRICCERDSIARSGQRPWDRRGNAVWALVKGLSYGGWRSVQGPSREPTRWTAASCHVQSYTMTFLLYL